VAKDIDKHQERVKEGLDRAYGDRETAETTFDIDEGKLVLFSDHHRGTKDGADDFWRCERAYHAALGHYFEAGHKLFLLGDVEELWENKPDEVMKKYRRTLELEQEFHRQGRLVRFWGNHDDNWRHEKDTAKYLHPLYQGLPVHEAMRIRIVEGGERIGTLFLVHGHQGTLDSDRWGAFSRIVVRNAWRPLQRRLKIPSTTPSRDFELRAGHNDAMFEWAKGRPERLVLIAGHTHQPVFSTPKVRSERKADIVKEELRLLRESGKATPAQLAALRAEYELVQTEQFGNPPKKMPLPCYFNTGCCSYGDGDVTGIEISDGLIRLVRWLNDESKAEVVELAAEPLRKVLEKVEGSHLR
jgi:Calcineurin-like phosphoesterase superfamily domain